MALTFTRHSLVVIVGALLLQLFFLAGLAPAAAAAGPTGQVTVFWGRNKDEGSLREACDTGLYTMVVMSFLNVYGARGGEYRLDLAGHPEEQDGRSGYVYPKTLYYRYVPELQKAANYGGFMIWDRYSDKQSGYSGYVKNWA
ncbi:hypothetical protein OsI_26977 [Oryza sativa Indica Group]|uniref:GH18 domain-containing protein n=1 Tax=Oryza sativa subsp. indica TaxID=39946 RepID=A2YNZ2_ORYSI|nr:hypothetical protein OsI_26977 [Oryza sativa Indica Group]